MRPAALSRGPRRNPTSADRSGARTTLQKLLSRFHFGVTLLAVALSGITILLAGITTLRSYADHNIELAARLGAYGAEPALVFNDPQAAREGLEPLMRLPGIARLRLLDDRDRGHDPQSRRYVVMPSTPSTNAYVNAISFR